MANSLITIKGLTNDQLPDVQAKLQAYVDTIWPEATVEVDEVEKDEEEDPEMDEDEEDSDEDGEAESGVENPGTINEETKG